MNGNNNQHFNCAVFDVQIHFILPDIVFDRTFEYILNNSRIIPTVISALTDSLCVKPSNIASGDLDELAT